jgi:hypothetical protein
VHMIPFHFFKYRFPILPFFLPSLGLAFEARSKANRETRKATFFRRQTGD